ncbi:MAG: hypothetical protein IKE38_02820 [Erysipelotrichaceae bacterium]|nr:hypothetical protein [Erysipelotrichaceae bacterium]
MKEKYAKVGLNHDLILSKFPDINEYEEIVNAYLSDPFFEELEAYLDDEDYALAKDALKGLYILAQDLYLYPLYMAIMEVYEDIEEEIYKDVMGHYAEMMRVYRNIRSVFHV